VHISWGTVVSVVGVLGFLVVVAGVLGAAFRTSRNVQSITNYRDAAQSWEARANAQEQELEQQARQIDACQKKIESLQRELAEKDRSLNSLQEQISSLRELLTGRAAFESLTEKIAESLALNAENRANIRKILDMEIARGQT
jgi:uncharacterized protein HemX